MSEKLNTLLVEDTPGDASIIEFYLAEQFSEFYNFSHVEKFADCLEELKNKKFDVVLLDLDLPDSHGMNTLKALMAAYPEQLVIVLTGLNDEKTGLETVQKGANDFMVKGKFDADMLNSKIKFAHERYLSKLSRNKNHFDTDTIHNILNLLNAGYLEIEKNHMVITKLHMNNLAHIFDLPIKNLAQLCSYIDNCEAIKDKILDLCIEDNKFHLEETTINGHHLVIEGMYSLKNNLISFLIAEKKL